jgi:hypothetical protein
MKKKFIKDKEVYLPPGTLHFRDKPNYLFDAPFYARYIENEFEKSCAYYNKILREELNCDCKNAGEEFNSYHYDLSKYFYEFFTNGVDFCMN